MKVLITGGAGFVGNKVVRRFLDKKHDVYIIDDFTTGTPDNLVDLLKNNHLKSIIHGNIKDNSFIQDLFGANFHICIHLACNSELAYIDNPVLTFDNIVLGTFNILEEARKKDTKLIYISTADVYKDKNSVDLKESHPVFPHNPFIGAKLATENMCLSYSNAYQHPIAILRPTIIYGQNESYKTYNDFMNYLHEITLNNCHQQTYDLLYVEDLAEIIYKFAVSNFSGGEIYNCGSGALVDRNNLEKYFKEGKEIELKIPGKVNLKKIQQFIEWQPKTTLTEGLDKLFT